ncbi:MAG: hypothetical protein HKO63_07270, partial [Acidimicrobiia bacterium]|nr:hypothetical protein [Acidimicrobiia bacterium]
TPGAEGAAVGLYRLAGDFGLVLGPLVLGSLADDGAFIGGFQLSAVLLVLAAAVALIIRRPRTHEHVPADAAGLP